MKIVYHHRTRAEDAQGIHIEEVQRAFRQLGHSVVEVALVPRGESGRIRSTPGGLVGLLSRIAREVPPAVYELLEAAGNLPEVARLLKAVAGSRPDLIYERYSLHNLAGALVSRLTGTPLVLEVNAPLAEERAEHGGLAFPGLARAVEALIWRSASTVVTVSGPLADRIAARGVSRERILVLPNAVRRELFLNPPEGAKVRDSLGIRADEVVCGFTGWFRPWHGLEAFLEGFHAAGLKDRSARVILVGDGQARPALERIVRERNLQRSVIFPGPIGRESIGSWIAAFDLAVQPAATPYASPMKLFEYLALGKPVVATGTPAICEVLTHGEDSLLFAPGDQASMISAVKRLVENPELRARLGRGARATIQRRGLFWDESARRTLDHFARCREKPAKLPVESPSSQAL